MVPGESASLVNRLLIIMVADAYGFLVCGPVLMGSYRRAGSGIAIQLIADQCQVLADARVEQGAGAIKLDFCALTRTGRSNAMTVPAGATGTFELNGESACRGRDNPN
jgi:hypothetical protein